jgi:cobalt-zinc-cadmium efflux system membrane fusion protein
VSELKADLARAQAGAAFAGPGSGATVVLRAPLGGTIVTLKGTAGMAVQQAGETIIEIGNPAALWVIADVFERDLPLLQTGTAARVDLPAAHGTLDGRVVSIGSVVASSLRTAPIRIALAVGTSVLRPGMYGRAEIDTASSSGLTLPTEAILIKGKDTIVYVQKDATTFTRRPVVVASPIDGHVQVISGLAPGERVVVHGALLLDGAAEQLM